MSLQSYACRQCFNPPPRHCWLVKHPTILIYYLLCGLTTSAFNMLPVGCLDGGRAIQGAFGKNTLFGFGLATYSLLGLGVLGGPLSLPWGLYVLICQVG
ncbi:hypothetical protein BHE74_00024531 [Ensete ventricosum]|nr:hypothetical protein BHE74_00024531 [Ensete ventricosum]